MIKIATYAVIAVTIIVFVLVWSFLHSWALSVLWAWFIVPLFRVPALSVSNAYGFVLIVNLLRFNAEFKGKYKDSADAYIGRAAVGILYPFVAVLAGWIVKTMFL